MCCCDRPICTPTWQDNVRLGLSCNLPDAAVTYLKLKRQLFSFGLFRKSPPHALGDGQHSFADRIRCQGIAGCRIRTDFACERQSSPL